MKKSTTKVVHNARKIMCKNVPFDTSCVGHKYYVYVDLNLLRWNDVPRTSRILRPKIAVFSQF